MTRPIRVGDTVRTLAIDTLQRQMTVEKIEGRGAFVEPTAHLSWTTRSRETGGLVTHRTTIALRDLVLLGEQEDEAPT